MSNIVFFDPNNIVTNKVTKYLQSVNTPDYENEQNILINPDVSLLINISIKYWKVNNNNIIEMSSNEKTLIDNINKAKTLREKKYKISIYDNNQRLNNIIFYDTDNNDGTYSGKAEETTYEYFNNTTILINKKIENFYFDGTIYKTENYNYYKNDNNELIEKKV
jgi:hypothetical protein